MPQHVWSSVSDPATFADAKPVGTGPFMLDKFSPQGYTLKQNPFYWNKSKVHVPEIDFPAYNTNANLVPPISQGQIDFAGNYVADIKSNFLAKSPENHTWLNSQPYFSANNVVSMYLNTTKAPLSDPAVRQAISYGINRVAAQRPGRDGLRAAGQLDQRAAAAQPPVVPGPVAGQQPPGRAVTRPRSPRSSRRTATPSRAASGPRTGRRSSSPSRTRSRTATTTPTTRSSRTS